MLNRETLKDLTGRTEVGSIMGVQVLQHCGEDDALHAEGDPADDPQLPGSYPSTWEAVGPGLPAAAD